MAEQVQEIWQPPDKCLGMGPEKPVDAISEVLNSENFPHFTWILNSYMQILDFFAMSAYIYNPSIVFCLTKAKVLLPHPPDRSNMHAITVIHLNPPFQKY